MANVGLLLSGAVLFLNSLMLREKAEAKSVAVFNFFVGILQIIIPLYLIMCSDQNHWTVYQNAATFLFGLTFLYVACTFYKGLDGTGLGWFSAWGAMIAIFYAVVSVCYFHQYVLGLTWVLWAFLWYLFYVLNILKKPVAKYVGKVACIQSFITLTIPALLALIGLWEEEMTQMIWFGVLVVAVVYFVSSGLKYRTK